VWAPRLLQLILHRQRTGMQIQTYSFLTLTYFFTRTQQQHYHSFPKLWDRSLDRNFWQTGCRQIMPGSPATVPGWSATLSGSTQTGHPTMPAGGPGRCWSTVETLASQVRNLAGPSERTLGRAIKRSCSRWIKAFALSACSLCGPRNRCGHEYRIVGDAGEGGRVWHKVFHISARHWPGNLLGSARLYGLPGA
jgi:hypothetical protein